MTIPPRFSEISDRPENFNIPGYASDIPGQKTDEYFRQIQKLGPETSTAKSPGWPKPSDLSEYHHGFGSSWQEPEGPAHPVFENVIPVIEPYFPLHSETMEDYFDSKVGRSLNESMKKLTDSYDSGERENGPDRFQWWKDSRERDYHHMLGHQETHTSNKTRLMDAYDEYLNTRDKLQPHWQAYVMSGGRYEIPQDLLEDAKAKRHKVDQAFQEMHNHLHGTCYRSDKKGGPCGYFGIPRGRDNCEYCKNGNPARIPGDPMRLASKNDPWAVEGDDNFKKPGKPQIETTPGWKTEVPEELQGQVPNVSDAEAAYSPTAEPFEAVRTVSAQDPRLAHMARHVQEHAGLYSEATLAYDEYLKARQHYDELEHVAGPSPDERQEKILADHRSKLTDLHTQAHELWHMMHTNLHTECPECENWNNPRDPRFCKECDEGCPMCSKDEPLRLSSRRIYGGNPQIVPRRKRETVPQEVPIEKPKTVPAPVPVAPPIPAPEKVPAGPSVPEREHEAVGTTAFTTWDVVDDWESKYQRIARAIEQQELDNLKVLTGEETSNYIDTRISSWAVTAEGLAGSNDQLYMDPMHAFDGTEGAGPSPKIPSEVDQGTSTEGLTASLLRRLAEPQISPIGNQAPDAAPASVQGQGAPMQSDAGGSGVDSTGTVAPAQSRGSDQQILDPTTFNQSPSTAPASTKNKPKSQPSGNGGGFNPLGLIKGVGELVGGGVVDAVSTALAPESAGASLAGDIVGTGIASNGISNIMKSV